MNITLTGSFYLAACLLLVVHATDELCSVLTSFIVRTAKGISRNPRTVKVKQSTWKRRFAKYSSFQVLLLMKGCSFSSFSATRHMELSSRSVLADSGQ